jgi:hypothetical protein
MIWRPQDDRKIAGRDTVQHRVVYLPAVMCGQIIPNHNSMKVGAGDIVQLEIPAHVVAEVAKVIGRGSNGEYTLNSTSRVLHTPSNMWSQARIPWLDCKDDGHLHPMVVVFVLSDMQYLHSSPPRQLHFSNVTQNTSMSIGISWGTWNTPRGGEQFQKPQTQN